MTHRQKIRRKSVAASLTEKSQKRERNPAIWLTKVTKNRPFPPNI